MGCWNKKDYSIGQVGNGTIFSGDNLTTIRKIIIQSWNPGAGEKVMNFEFGTGAALGFPDRFMGK